MPLPSGTSIGTRKKRATEEKQQKKNATIRQHYYPEVVFLDWVICKNYLVYNYLNTKYLFSGWVGLAGLGLCTCRKPSWPRTSTQLWGASLDIFTLTFIIHFNQFKISLDFYHQWVNLFTQLFHQVTLVAICRRWGGASSRAAGEKLPFVIKYQVLRTSKATGQLVRNFALFLFPTCY